MDVGEFFGASLATLERLCPRNKYILLYILRGGAKSLRETYL